MNQLQLKTEKHHTNWSTQAGEFSTKKKATVNDLKLINFSTKRKIRETKLSVNTNPTQKYAAIFGRNFLEANGIDFIFSEKKIWWDGIEIFMDSDNTNLEQAPEDSTTEVYNNEISANKYRPFTVKEIAELAGHLSTGQQAKLLEVLKYFEDIFKGVPGKWKDLEIDIELTENAKPYHAKPYKIPFKLTEVVKEEIYSLVRKKALKR